MVRKKHKLCTYKQQLGCASLFLGGMSGGGTRVTAKTLWSWNCHNFTITCKYSSFVKFCCVLHKLVVVVVVVWIQLNEEKQEKRNTHLTTTTTNHARTMENFSSTIT